MLHYWVINYYYYRKLKVIRIVIIRERSTKNNTIL